MADEEITKEPETTETPQEEVKEAPKEDSRSQDRIRELSEKVELTSKERDELKTLNVKLEQANAFSEGYAEILSSQPAAKDFKEEIREKVSKGYSVEDATYAVLGREGRLEPLVKKDPESPAGGSADTTPPQGEKTIEEMSLEEKREILSKSLTFGE